MPGPSRSVSEGRCYSLFRLLPQQMVSVSNEFCYRVGLHRIVVTTDLTTSIHQDHSSAVHRKSLCIVSV